MSETIEEVIEVGRRHHLNPTLLEIDVRKLKRAWNRYQKKGGESIRLIMFHLIV